MSTTFDPLKLLRQSQEAKKRGVPAAPSGLLGQAPTGFFDAPILPSPIPAPSLRQIGRFGLEALPAIGATAAVLGTGGGAIPAIAAAFLGGAGSTGGRDIAKGVFTEDPLPPTPTAVAKTMVGEGVEQALAEAGGRLVVKGAKVIGPKLLESAKHQYYQAFGITPSKVKEFGKTADEMLKREIRGMAPTVQGKIATGLQDARDALDDAFANLPPGEKLDVSGILNKLEDAKQRFVSTAGEIASKGKQAELLAAAEKAGTPPPLFANVIDKEANQAIAALEEVQGALVQSGQTQVPVQELLALKKYWADAVAEAGGYHGKELKEAARLRIKQRGADEIRREMATTHPGFAKVNQEFSFMKRAENLLEHMQRRQVGKSGESLGYGGYILAGSIARGDVGKGLTVVGLLNSLRSAFNSTWWNTVAPVWKNRLADLIAMGDEKQAAQVVSTMLRFPTFYQEAPSMTPGAPLPGGPPLMPERRKELDRISPDGFPPPPR